MLGRLTLERQKEEKDHRFSIPWNFYSSARFVRLRPIFVNFGESNANCILNRRVDLLNLINLLNLNLRENRNSDACTNSIYFNRYPIKRTPADLESTYPNFTPPLCELFVRYELLNYYYYYQFELFAQ